jgi:ATP-dependent Lon protease
MGYDLSKVMFIATANSLTPIHRALRDRMEMISVSGYTIEEKTSIGQKFLLPKQLKEHGMKKIQLNLKKTVLEKNRRVLY